MAEQRSTNITWHEGQVTRKDRERVLGQRGATIWLTGLSGSGKSTIAVAAEKALTERRRLAYVLDGDNVRHGLNKNLGFSPEDRTENIRRIGEVAKLFTDSGVLVFTSFISPYRSDRDAVRTAMGEADFIEVYVAASLDTCAAQRVEQVLKSWVASENASILMATHLSGPVQRLADFSITLRDGQLGPVAECD